MGKLGVAQRGPSLIRTRTRVQPPPPRSPGSSTGRGAGAVSKAAGPRRGWGASPRRSVPSLESPSRGVAQHRRALRSGRRGRECNPRHPDLISVSSKVERPAVNRTDPGASPGRRVLDAEPDEAPGRPAKACAPHAGVRCESSDIRGAWPRSRAPRLGRGRRGCESRRPESTLDSALDQRWTRTRPRRRPRLERAWCPRGHGVRVLPRPNSTNTSGP